MKEGGYGTRRSSECEVVEEAKEAVKERMKEEGYGTRRRRSSECEDGKRVR